MLTFINAKINIGLQITSRRSDGYHELATLFYPVGKYAGTAENPVSFCDILEILPSEYGMSGFELEFRGRKVDCPREKHLVYRAAKLYFEQLATPGFGVRMIFEKHLPDGAGMGGGSADASETLKLLSALDSEMNGERSDFRHRDEELLAKLALKLGADCPFFIYNRPMYACGVGEKLRDMDLDLSGKWLVAIKPRVSISTKEAFAGVVPCESAFDLRTLGTLPIERWQDVVVNDFEKSLFPRYPELGLLKNGLRDRGALYSSLTGSGSVVYGIFADESSAASASHDFKEMPTIEGVYLLKL